MKTHCQMYLTWIKDKTVWAYQEKKNQEKIHKKSDDDHQRHRHHHAHHHGSVDDVMMRIGFALVAGRSQIVIINISPGVTEIPSNIDRSSNRYNLGSRWAIEDPKKKKIIRIWRSRWWAHQIRSSCKGIVARGLYSYLKNRVMRPKRGCRKQLQKIFQGHMRGFSWCQRYKYPKSIAKLNLSYQVWSHGGFTFFKY